jgi:hypothetical protein
MYLFLTEGNRSILKYICKEHKNSPGRCVIHKETLFKKMYISVINAFSHVLLLKDKHRLLLSNHHLEANLRISISNIIPDMEILCKKMASHPAHLIRCPEWSLPLRHSD